MARYEEIEQQVLEALKNGFENELLSVALDVVNRWGAVTTTSSKVYFDIQSQVVEEHLNLIIQQRIELVKEVSDFLVRAEAKALQIRQLEELLIPIKQQYIQNVKDISTYEKEVQKRGTKESVDKKEKMPLCSNTKASK